MIKKRNIAIGSIVLTFVAVLLIGTQEVSPKRTSVLKIKSNRTYDSTIVIAVDNNVISTFTYYNSNSLDVPSGVSPLHSSSVVLHGDVNMSGSVTGADVIYLMNYVFRGGPEAIYDTLGNRELYIWEENDGVHVRYLKHYRGTKHRRKK